MVKNIKLETLNYLFHKKQALGYNKLDIIG
jgi:hypothetical protein